MQSRHAFFSLTLLSSLVIVSSHAVGQPAPAQPQPAPPPPAYAPYPYPYQPYPGYPPPAAAERPPPPPPKRDPPARTGFQMHLLTGVMVPAGRVSAASGDELGRRYAWQVPFEVGLGGKPSEKFYVGGLFGFSIGAEGSDTRVEQACDDSDSNLDNDITCNTYTVRLAIEGRYFFSPAGSSNPWLGYGIGFEAANQSIHDRARGRKESTTVSGFELARLGFGVDFRLNGTFGVGPALTLAFGRFSTTRTEVNDDVTFDGDIDDPAFHMWGTLGARMVFLP
jgi:hypothetical protein